MHRENLKIYRSFSPASAWTWMLGLQGGAPNTVNPWVSRVTWCVYISAAVFASLGMAKPCEAENVVSTTTGSSANRVDVVIVGDGYQQQEMELYHQHVDAVFDYIFFGTEDPFHRYQNFFNFHRVEVISAESGADIPPEGVFVDTALEAKYFFDGVTERLLGIDSFKADSIVTQSLPRGVFPDMRFAVVNVEQLGGLGGTYATFAGGNPESFEIALHEIAHSFSPLEDEYVSFRSEFPRPEPEAVNLTKDPSGAKWERWLGYEQEGIGTIGVYEGGGFYETGVYRPSLDSKMRTLGRPFDAIARERLVLDVYRHVAPIDSHSDNGQNLGFLDEPWVDTVDPNVLTTRWFLDEDLVAENGEVFSIRNLMNLGVAAGSYELKVEVVDETDWIRLETERPRESVVWALDYFPGDFDNNQRVDEVDLDLLSEAMFADAVDLNFDLTQDSFVNQNDRDLWLTVNGYLPGDLDLDGAVNFADFLQMSAGFGTSSNLWTDGNIDSEPGIAFGDFLILSANFGQTQSSSLAGVPEPKLSPAWILLVTLLARGSKNRPTLR